MRLYTEQKLIVGEPCVLELAPSKHLLRVLRCQVGDRCVVFNGDGAEYEAELIAVDRHATLMVVAMSRPAVESPLQITLAQSISRGERMDYAIQKSVECGVHAIVPIISERCGVKLSAERASKRQAHWQAVATSASEQSGRCRLPIVSPLASLQDWLQAVSGDVFVADIAVQDPIGKEQAAPTFCSVLIGPEGGFSDRERQLFARKKCYGLSLGPRILRTETAPIVALTQLQLRWGDLG